MSWNKLLTTIIDSIPMICPFKDPDDDFRYVYWNKELEKNTGLLLLLLLVRRMRSYVYIRRS